MPNYEYRCLDCNKRFEKYLSYSEYGKTKVSCPFCESFNITRKIGRIRIGKNPTARMEAMADPDQLSRIDDDPAALGSMMRQMSNELGEEMPSEFNEVVDRLEKGQTPEQIDRELPDLAEPSAANNALSSDD